MAMLRSRSLFVVLGLLGGAAWAEPALAAGFSSARFGAEHGNPVTPNATAVYYNPASLGETEGIHIFLDGSLALRSATWTHAPAASDDVTTPGANDGTATLFNAIAAPMIGASAKFGDFAVGAGFYVPFGGQATWDKNDDFELTDADISGWQPGQPRPLAGAYDGVQRWHTISGAIQSMYFTIAAAYKLPFGLSIGASFNGVRSSVKTLRARVVDGTNSLAAEGRSLIDVSALNASFGVGLMYEAMPKKLWIGASYQAQPGLGQMELTGSLNNNLSGTPEPEQDVSLYQTLPDVVRAGVRWRAMDNFELRLFGDFTRWSVMKNQCLVAEGQPCEVNEDGSAAEGSDPIVNLPRDWNDAFGVRAGLSFWPSEGAELFSGLGYDSNAVPDETLEPSLADYHDVSVALGGRVALGDHLNLAVSYTHFFYVQRDTTGKSTLPAKLQPTRSPDAGGVYSQTLGVINANLDVNF